MHQTGVKPLNPVGSRRVLHLEHLERRVLAAKQISNHDVSSHFDRGVCGDVVCGLPDVCELGRNATSLKIEQQNDYIRSRSRPLIHLHGIYSFKERDSRGIHIYTYIQRKVGVPLGLGVSAVEVLLVLQAGGNLRIHEQAALRCTWAGVRPKRGLERAEALA